VAPICVGATRFAVFSIPVAFGYAQFAGIQKQIPAPDSAVVDLVTNPAPQFGCSGYGDKSCPF
jgi:hypothetical protein